MANRTKEAHRIYMANRRAAQRAACGVTPVTPASIESEADMLHRLIDKHPRLSRIFDLVGHLEVEELEALINGQTKTAEVKPVAVVKEVVTPVTPKAKELKVAEVNDYEEEEELDLAECERCGNLMNREELTKFSPFDKVCQPCITGLQIIADNYSKKEGRRV